MTLFAGESNTLDCQNLMNNFDTVCSHLGVPVAQEKTEGPTTKLHYFGFLIDTERRLIKIPDENIVE